VVNDLQEEIVDWEKEDSGVQNADKGEDIENFKVFDLVDY